MRPAYDRDRVCARFPHRSTSISLLAAAIVAALSACGDSTTSPASNANAPELREARAFTVDGITYPTVAIQNGNGQLAIGDKETLRAKLATPTATWMGAYMIWSSSNSSVATISTSNWGSSNGDLATVTAVGNGTATITATTRSGTSGSITITVGKVTNVNQGGYHEPAGMHTQVNTGPMSTAPSNWYPNNKWMEGSAQFSNWSPPAMSSVGEWAGNLSAVPGGTGLRVTYQPSLVGGGSPVRFGTAIPDPGTGYLYVRFKIRLSPNFTLSRASGLKICEPRTPQTTENHVIGLGSDGMGTDGSNMWFGALLQFMPPGQNTTGINVPGTPLGQAPVPSQVYAAGNTANVGGAARGQWHTLEAYYYPESPAGNGNAQLTFWVDGAQVWQSGGKGAPPHGLHFFLPGETKGWNYLQFDPTYGGDQATDHPPYSIYWDLDELYISTR